MTTSNTFKSVVAMRIKLGLLRVKIAVEPHKMVQDDDYAALVLQQCRDTGTESLNRLADVFEEILKGPTMTSEAGTSGRWQMLRSGGADASPDLASLQS